MNLVRVTWLVLDQASLPEFLNGGFIEPVFSIGRMLILGWRFLVFLCLHEMHFLAIHFINDLPFIIQYFLLSLNNRYSDPT